MFNQWEKKWSELSEFVLNCYAIIITLWPQPEVGRRPIIKFFVICTEPVAIKLSLASYGERIQPSNLFIYISVVELDPVRV